MSRFLFVLEILFWPTFWLQTRLNLRDWWPNWFSSPLNSDYLIPFIYLSDIVLVSLLAVWIVNKGAKSLVSEVKSAYPLNLKPEIWLKSPWLWLVIFIVSASLSVVINGGEWWSWYGWWRILEGFLLGLYVYQRWQIPRIRQYALTALMVGLIFESLILIGEWGRQASLGWQWLGEWSFNLYTPGIAKVVFNGQEYMRAYGTFAHPNVAAAALLLGIIVLGWWQLKKLYEPAQRQAMASRQRRATSLLQRIEPWWRNTNVSQQYIFIVASSLLVIGLLVTFSRSVWLVLIVCLALLLFWSSRSLSKLHFSRDKIIGILLGCILLGIIWGPMIWGRFSALDSTDRLSIDRRVQLNEIAVDLFNQHPWFGVGNNNFVINVSSYGPLFGIGVWREPVHNLYLLIATETGIVGTIAWVVAQVLLWTQIVNATRQGRADTNLALVIIIWVAVILLGFTDHYWWTSQPGRLIWWTLFGATLAILNRLNEPEATTNPTT